MSTQIGTTDIKNFFIENYHTDKISLDDAKDLGINVSKFDFADTNDDNSFDLDEIGDVNKLLAAFTSVIEKERETEAKDAEKEKEEETKVKDKNEAKA